MGFLSFIPKYRSSIGEREPHPRLFEYRVVWNFNFWEGTFKFPSAPLLVVHNVHQHFKTSELGKNAHQMFQRSDGERVRSAISRLLTNFPMIRVFCTIR